MKTLTNALVAMSLVLPASLMNAPQAKAGIFLTGATVYFLSDCHRYAPSPETCVLSHRAVAVGFLGGWVSALFGQSTLEYIAFPAPQSDIEGSISTELPFLNTSDVYALGSIVRQKLGRDQMTPVRTSPLGAGFEVKLERSEILSVISGDYSQPQIDRAVELLD